MGFNEVATSLGLSAEAIEAIPKEVREDKALEPIKDFTGALKSYIDGQKMIGKVTAESIRIPKDDDEKGWGELHGKLGRPESPDKYQVTLNKPDVVSWNQDYVNSMKQVFHKIGLNNKQAQVVLDAYAETVVQDNLAMKKAFDECVTTLKNDWGGAFDRNTALAKRLIAAYGGEEVKNFFKNDPVGNSPWMARMLAKIAEDLDEGGLLEGGETGEVLGAESARAQIASIMANPEDLYHAKHAGKPGHKERVEEVSRLYAVAYNTI
jgi:hypothetical protein